MSQHMAWRRLSVTVMIIGVPGMPARIIRPSRSISIRQTFVLPKYVCITLYDDQSLYLDS